MEFDPVGCGSAADVNQLVLRQMEQNAIADDEPVVTARRKMLRPVHRELGKRVERQVRYQFQGIGPFDINVHHVMRLVKEYGALPPRALLVAPIRILIGHNGIHIGSNLRIPEHVGHVSVALDQAF